MLELVQAVLPTELLRVNPESPFGFKFEWMLFASCFPAVLGARPAMSNVHALSHSSKKSPYRSSSSFFNCCAVMCDFICVRVVLKCEGIRKHEHSLTHLHEGHLVHCCSAVVRAVSLAVASAAICMSKNTHRS